MKKRLALAKVGIITTSLLAMAVFFQKVRTGYTWEHSFNTVVSPYYWSLVIQSMQSQSNTGNRDASKDPYKNRFNSPREFERWMNKNATWRNSAKIRFFNLEECQSNYLEYSGGTYSYNCSGGYAQISSPLGEQICAITDVRYQVDSYRNQDWRQSTTNCVTPKEIAESRDQSSLSSLGLLALGGVVGWGSGKLIDNARRGGKG